MELSELKINPNNPRHISQDEKAKLKDSINGFSKMMKANPIIIDENNVILSGNQRFQSLLELGYKDIPDDWVRQVTDFTEKEKKEFLVKMNTHSGVFDFEEFDDEYCSDVDYEEWVEIEDEQEQPHQDLTKETKEEKFKSKDPNISDTDFKKLAGYNTAMNRTKISAPFAWYQKNKLLKGSVLDYGAGMDKHEYERFDPAFNPDYELLNKKYDTVVCNYVINVIPLEHNRFELIRVLQSLINEGGYIYLAVYGKDGVDTETDQSFQCGWSLQEWKSFLDNHCAYEVMKSPFWSFRIA